MEKRLKVSQKLLTSYYDMHCSTSNSSADGSEIEDDNSGTKNL